MKSVHRAWGVCLGCAILIFCTSGLVTNAFSIYMPYILDREGFSGTGVSMILTVRTLSSFAVMFLTGIYYDRLSLRTGMTLAGILVAAGFLVYGLSSGYAGYYAGSVLAGLGYGLGSMVPIGIMLNRWFARSLSSAVGICTCVTGLSTLGIPSLITMMIAKYGLHRTFMLESLVILILVLLSCLLISNSPEEKGCLPYGSDASSGSERADGKNGLGNAEERAGKGSGHLSGNYRPVIGGRLWLVLVPMMLLLGGYTSSAYTHLPLLMAGENISTEKAALVILASGLAVTASKFLYGRLADRYTAYRCNWIFGMLTFAGLMICITCRGSLPAMALGIVLYSSGLGMSTVGLVVWCRELGAAQDFEKNNRRLQLLYVGGSLVFSSFPGILADVSGGSYLPAFAFFAASALAVTLIIQTIYMKAGAVKNMGNSFGHRSHRHRIA